MKTPRRYHARGLEYGLVIGIKLFQVTLDHLHNAARGLNFAGSPAELRIPFAIDLPEAFSIPSSTRLSTIAVMNSGLPLLRLWIASARSLS